MSYTQIDEYLWQVEKWLMNHYGTGRAQLDIAPLKWYIGTDRAPLDFMRAMLTKKPYLIAKKLHAGGTYDEAINRLKSYLMPA